MFFTVGCETFGGITKDAMLDAVKERAVSLFIAI